MGKIQTVIDKITAQQKGLSEEDIVYAIGEQLKDICRESEEIAELVLTDLENPDMSIESVEKQIEKKADELHEKSKKRNVGISYFLVEKIIREFYGLPPKGAAPVETNAPKIFNLEDLI